MPSKAFTALGLDLVVSGLPSLKRAIRIHQGPLRRYSRLDFMVSGFASLRRAIRRPLKPKATHFRVQACSGLQGRCLTLA